jgi:hypothetical protein
VLDTAAKAMSTTSCAIGAVLGHGAGVHDELWEYLCVPSELEEFNAQKIRPQVGAK